MFCVIKCVRNLSIILITIIQNENNKKITIRIVSYICRKNKFLTMDSGYTLGKKWSNDKINHGRMKIYYFVKIVGYCKILLDI